MEIEGQSKNASGTDKETVEGLKGTRLSTFMMLTLWGGCIAFRIIDMGWTTIECYNDFDDDATEEICIRYSSIYR